MLPTWGGGSAACVGGGGLAPHSGGHWLWGQVKRSTEGDVGRAHGEGQPPVWGGVSHPCGGGVGRPQWGVLAVYSRRVNPELNLELRNILSVRPSPYEENKLLLNEY